MLVLTCLSLQSYNPGATERLFIHVFVLSGTSCFAMQLAVHLDRQADGGKERNTQAQQCGSALRRGAWKLWCVAVFAEALFQVMRMPKSDGPFESL